MPWFRVTLAAGERRRTERIEAQTLSDAREAYSRARLPGIHIIAVEPDPDSNNAAVTAAPLGPRPDLPPVQANATACDAEDKTRSA